MYLHMMCKIMKRKLGVVTLCDNEIISKCFILVTMATIYTVYDIQILSIFNMCWPLWGFIEIRLKMYHLIDIL